jgi:hypothetical protein
MSIPIRFQFVPQVVKGVMDGASQVLPTGSGQMLYYEIRDGAYSTNAAGVATLQGVGRLVGIISYDFLNSRWSCNFSDNGVLSTHQSTVYENDIAQITLFIATLSSPPVPLTDEVGNDVPWPASIPKYAVA